jgi:hypothetical protein
VEALDIGGRPIIMIAPKGPKWSVAFSAGMLTAGTFRWRPMVSAISRTAMPSSVAAISCDPAGAFSSASA